MPAASQINVWPQAQPEEMGFARDLADKLDFGIRSGLLRGLHAVLVARAGRLVLERYDAGVDDAWGRPLGEIRFNADTLHDLRSVTKSLVGLLYGIARERGLVAPPEAPLLAQFPEHSDLAADPQRARLTVDHALTMTLGIEWNEQIPYTDAANSEVAMERAPDRIRFILERPVTGEPGSRWTYCGGATALIGALIAKGAGMPLESFAHENLFAPLGIPAFEWSAGRDGVASAASGLRLRPRDLLRIGELMLAQGWWGDRQIVPREWIARVTEPVIPTGDGLDYGRHWFLGEAMVPAAPERPQPWIGAFGNGGQRLWIMPSMNLCAVILAGNYDTSDGWVFPTRVWREIILANLVRT
jgi:CubicO group peptidase (beta-lactamase class C family)